MNFDSFPVMDVGSVISGTASFSFLQNVKVCKLLVRFYAASFKIIDLF